MQSLIPKINAKKIKKRYTEPTKKAPKPKKESPKITLPEIPFRKRRKFSLFKKYEKNEKSRETSQPLYSRRKQKIKGKKHRTLDRYRPKEIENVHPKKARRSNLRFSGDFMGNGGFHFFKIKKKKIQQFNELSKIKKSKKFAFFQKTYVITRLLKKGSESIMLLCINKRFNFRAAVKVIRSSSVQKPEQLKTIKVS